MRRTMESRVESLESRRLLSAAADHSQALLADGFVPIDWQGEEAFARPGEWIVRLSGIKGNSAKQLKDAGAALGGLGQGLKASRYLGSDGLVLIQAPAGATYDDLADSLGRLGNFQDLEPNFAVWADDVPPSDPLYNNGTLWGLNNSGQNGGTADADIDAPEAWGVATGDGSVVVGVIDTGVDYSHPDLQGDIWTNTAEANGTPGFDDDNNGYVDDVHGYDFVNNDGDPMDDNSHGTHVSGTIAGRANNGQGVVGVNWNAQIMGIKFLDSTGGGTTAAAISAVNYATMMRGKGVNIRLTSNSWGGGTYSEELKTAIDNSGKAGMLFVAAAGNSNLNADASPQYPAAYDLRTSFPSRPLTATMRGRRSPTMAQPTWTWARPA
jgi:subtilisin family serine protease